MVGNAVSLILKVKLKLEDMTQEEQTGMWDAQANIERLAEDAEHTEHLIAEYGENRSLGNVLQNIKARLKYWMDYEAR